MGGKNLGKGLAPTRLYVYPEVDRELLHVITLGDKSTQPDDIQTSKRYVQELQRKRQEEQPAGDDAR